MVSPPTTSWAGSSFSAVLVTMGTFLTRAGRSAEAEARFREAVAQDPDNPLAHASLGFLLARQDRTDEAIAELERRGGCSRTGPTSPPSSASCAALPHQ